MAKYNKGMNGWCKFGIALLGICALVGVGFILDATIPACHNAFVTAIDWCKDLFTKSEEVKETTEAVVSVIKN